MEFSYKARNRQGELITGTIQAENIHEAAQYIRQKGLWVTMLSEKSASPLSKKISLPLSLSINAIGKKEAVFFCQELHVLLETGMPVHAALATMTSSSHAIEYTHMLEQIVQDVKRGTPLSSAMAKFPNVFSEMILALVRSGEASGALEPIMRNLADFLERDYRAHERLKSIMTYPLALLAITCIMFVFMTLFVLPTFATILSSLDVPLPLLTELLLQGSAFLSQHLLEAIGCTVFLSAMVWFLFQQPNIRARLDYAFLTIPIFGTLVLYTHWRILLETLAVLQRSGITLAQSLNMSTHISGNLAFQYMLQYIARDVSEGKKLSDTLKATKLFPSILGSMIATGEASGEMERMMEYGAAYCATTASNLSSRIEALAEPAVMLVIGGIIFVFILSIVLPMLNTMDAFI